LYPEDSTEHIGIVHRLGKSLVLGIEAADIPLTRHEAGHIYCDEEVPSVVGIWKAVQKSRIQNKEILLK
jgi:hypothetical protein